MNLKKFSKIALAMAIIAALAILLFGSPFGITRAAGVSNAPCPERIFSAAQAKQKIADYINTSYDDWRRVNIAPIPRGQWPRHWKCEVYDAVFNVTALSDEGRKRINVNIAVTRKGGVMEIP